MTCFIDPGVPICVTECTRPTASEPFLCLDLSYITALLREGFGYSESTKLYVSIFRLMSYT